MAARDRFELCSRNHDCPATWNSYSVSPLSVWESVAQSTRMSGWISPVLSSRLVTDVARLHYEFFKVTNYVSTPIACRADRQWWPSNVDVSARRYKFTRGSFAKICIYIICGETDQRKWNLYVLDILHFFFFSIVSGDFAVRRFL